MSKFSLNLGEGGVKGLFLRHVEKLVLALVVVLAAVIFCAGYSIESLPGDKTPTALQEIALRAESHVENEDVWHFLKEQRKNILDHSRRVSEGRLAITPLPYPVQRFTWPHFRMQDQRSDPELYPPINVEVRVFLAAFALQSGEVHAALDDQKDAAVAKEEEEAKKKPKPKKVRTYRKQRGYDEEEEDEGLDDLDDLEEPMDDLLEDDEGLDDEAEEAEDSFVLSSSVADNFGVIIPSSSATFKGYYVVAVSAVVPYQKQWLDYDFRFSNALGYDPSTDLPEYFLFVAERAEIPADFKSDDPKAVEKLEWKLVGHTNYDIAQAERWESFYPEVANLNYLDKFLTMPAPPALMVDISDKISHSKVPKQEYESELVKREPMINRKSINLDEGLRPSSKISSTYSLTQSESPEEDVELDEEFPDESEFEDEFMEDDIGTDDSVAVNSETGIPKYKMIRFFDLTAERGKSYQYRFQVWLRDPNNPFGQGVIVSGESHARRTKALKDTMLKKEVLARLQEQQDREKDLPLEDKTYWRKTEWSEPSDTITVPKKFEKFFAGAVTPGKEIKISAKGAKFLRTEPYATVLSVVWDDTFSVNVPSESKALRGTVLNYQINVDVFHPIARNFRRLNDYEYNTDAVVLDIRGGEKLRGGSKDNSVLATGEVLIMDSDGNLLARNELDNMRDYRRALLIHDELSKPATSPNDSLAEAPY